MSKWRRGDGMRRALQGTVSFGVFCGLLLGLGASTCGWNDSAIDRCETSADCYNLPGTQCIETMCVCSHPEHQFCDGQCRPMAECLPTSNGGAGGGSGGNGGVGGVPNVECKTGSDCKQPGNSRCGQANCENGLCSLDLKPFSKLTSQVQGDCKHLWCDGDGNLVEIEDGSDVYNDGVQCSSDLCKAGQPTVQPYPNASMCPETLNGVCFLSECVECIDGMLPCGNGLVCNGGRCIPMHCDNNQWDQALGETAQNCGGSCLPCAIAQYCKIPKDCFTGVCLGGVCQPPTNSDGVKNDAETGVDCGGPPSALRCDDGQGCKVGSDCSSLICWAGVCVPPKCTDGIKNGDETDWDCGGSCGPC